MDISYLIFKNFINNWSNNLICVELIHLENIKKDFFNIKFSTYENLSRNLKSISLLDNKNNKILRVEFKKKEFFFNKSKHQYIITAICRLK